MTLERFWQTVVVNCEALPREVLPAASEAAGKRVLGTFVVADLSGFGLVLVILLARYRVLNMCLQHFPVLADEGLRTQFVPSLSGLFPRDVSIFQYCTSI